MQTSRTTLYNNLAMVRAGLATGRETCEQSACFVFSDGFVSTFNEEIACRMPCGIGVEAAAVVAKGLLELLEKLPDDNIDISETESHLVIKGSGRRLTIPKQSEITLPIHLVPVPVEWYVLPGGLVEACCIAAQSTKKDSDKFLAQCVHLGPGFVEACDNERASRVMVEGLDADVLVRGVTVRQVSDIHATEWAMSADWLHFTNSTGIQFSCRSHQKVYVNLEGVLAGVDGESLTLPPNLSEIVERANKMSSLAVGDNYLTVTVKNGFLTVTGEGTSGKYEERVAVSYAGPSVAFTVPPEMLLEICKTHTIVTVDSSKIGVKSTNMVAVMAVKATT